MKNYRSFAIIFLVIIGIFGCSNEKDGGDGKGGQIAGKPTPLDWDSIPSHYSKSIETQNLSIGNVDQIRLLLFDFKDDFEVIYGDSLSATQGKLEVYWVANEKLNYGSNYISLNGKSLDFNKVGDYVCDHQIENGQLIRLQGSCIVKVRLLLPTGKALDILNAGISQSASYAEVSTEQFLASFNGADGDTLKLQTIKEFLNSHAGKAKRPYLDINHFSYVLVRFTQSANKMQALRLLHKFLGDRTHLAYTIDNCFATPEERKEARKIVGI